MASRLHYIWLAQHMGADAAAAQALLAAFGTPEAVYAADRRALTSACAGLRAAQVDALCNKETDDAEQIIEDCTRRGVQIITIEDSAYPDRLRAIADPPCVLYVRGKWPDFDVTPGVSVVGTREATPYGQRMAQAIGGALAGAGFITVSGMARGSDAAAHRGALHGGGLTVAVLAGGVDICYPQENRGLMGDILLSGALISEKPPGTPHKSEYFPHRNRIISGLSVAVVVVEAAARSGTAITAHHALDQGRDVYAVPGALGARMSEGCNKLIERGEAALLSDPAALVRAYRGLLREAPNISRVRQAFLRQVGTPNGAPAWQDAKQREQKPKRPPAPKPPMPPDAAPKAPEVPLGEEEKRLVELIAQGASTPPELVERSGMPPARAMSLLTGLELSGVVCRERGQLILK